jgi:hypothetical protein
MRLTHSIGCGLLLAAVAAPPGLTPGPPPPAPERQTGKGALDRANRRLDWWTRQGRPAHETTGTWGRKNALIDNMHLSEEPPLVQPPLSGRWHF